MKEKIIGVIFTISMILIAILLMILFSRSYNNDMDRCINAGHTKEYCERGM